MGCFSVAPGAAERRGWITKPLEVREVGCRGSAVAATAIAYAVEVPPLPGRDQIDVRATVIPPQRSFEDRGQREKPPLRHRSYRPSTTRARSERTAFKVSRTGSKKSPTRLGSMLTGQAEPVTWLKLLGIAVVSSARLAGVRGSQWLSMRWTTCPSRLVVVYRMR